MNRRSNYLLKVALAFLLSVLITSLLIIPAKAVPKSDKINTDEPYRVETFELSDTGSLNIETSGGHITVEGGINGGGSSVSARTSGGIVSLSFE